MDYMASIGVITFEDSEELQRPSKIRRFLDKAIHFGLASMISLSTLIGMGTPALAYADETSPDPSDVYIELADGIASINLPEVADLSREVYLTGENNSLVEVSQGSRLYDYVMEQIDAGCPDSVTDFLGYIGKVDGASPVTLSVPEQTITYQGKSKCLDSSTAKTFGESFKFSNSSLASMYHMYLDDGQFHPFRMMVFEAGSDLAVEIGLWEHVDMPDEMVWNDESIAAELGYGEGEYFDYDEYFDAQRYQGDENANIIADAIEAMPLPVKILESVLFVIVVIGSGYLIFSKILDIKGYEPINVGLGHSSSYMPD